MSSLILLINSLSYICLSQTYTLTEHLLSFNDHEAYCSFACYTNLASIHNASQNNEAKSLCSNQAINCWIGLSNRNSQWIWNDGSLFNYGTDTSGGIYPWSNENTWEQPDGSGNCVNIYANDKDWDDGSCTASGYAICNYPTPIQVFNDNPTYQRIPSYNNSIGTMDVFDEIHIAFDFIINSWNYNLHQWTCILLIGSDSQRMPGIYMDNVEKWLHPVWFNVNTGQWLSSGVGSLELNISYHFEFYATQNWIKTTLNSSNGNIIIKDAYMPSHSIFKNLSIWMGGLPNWGDPADVVVSGLKITTSNTHDPDPFFNYLCDYSNRFSNETGTGIWNFNNNTCHVTQSDPVYSGNIIWMGVRDPNSLTWTDYKVEVVMNMLSGTAISVILRKTYGKQYSVS
eukprot:124896_1